MFWFRVGDFLAAHVRVWNDELNKELGTGDRQRAFVRRKSDDIAEGIVRMPWKACESFAGSA